MQLGCYIRSRVQYYHVFSRWVTKVVNKSLAGLILGVTRQRSTENPLLGANGGNDRGNTKHLPSGGQNEEQCKSNKNSTQPQEV